MDDCDLEKLSIKPGKLSPKFNRQLLEYNVTLASDVPNITLDCLTSDTGASYSILGSDGSKTIALKEGIVTDVKIEVTAEDGKTTKIYIIHVKRLSAKDASLTAIKLSAGNLQPEFSADIFNYTYNGGKTTKIYIIHVKRLSAKDASLTAIKLSAENSQPEFSADIFNYTCCLSCCVNELTVTATATDVKCVITVCGKDASQPVKLNTGQTDAAIQVCSVDGSNTAEYLIKVTKKQIPRYVKIHDAPLAMKYQCPVSLSALYLPISIRNSDPKRTYSGPIIDEFTKTSKVDPLSEEALIGDWKIEDADCELKLNEIIASIPFTGGGATDAVKLQELGGMIEKCNLKPKSEDLTGKFKAQTDKPSHSVQVRSWEKQLLQIFDESNADKLVKQGEEHIEKYFKSLPTMGVIKKYPEGESPIDHLYNASCCFATAIKSKPRDASLHLRLGMLLEEKYYAEDRYGLKNEEMDELPSLNMEAKESSKEEEVAAICKLRGVDENSPLALQLKAVDEEYHHLINSGQSGKADHVQSLFVWKSKQATQEGAAAQKAADEENPLGQAYLKYMDAMVLDDSKAVYNFHVGRMLVIQGEYDVAVNRLETALAWNPQHESSRFYLGLTLALKKNGPGERKNEAIAYLVTAMETLLAKNTETAMKVDISSSVQSCLHADDLTSQHNIHLLRSIIQLGILLRSSPNVKDVMTAEDVFHTAALLAAQTLTLTCRGDSYKQIEWVLLGAHSNLLELLLEKSNGNRDLIIQRCQRLSALIKRTTIPQNAQLLSLQRETCEKLVLMNACDSHSIYLLGCAQFSQCENSLGDESDKLLTEAKLSFKASIDLEGKPATGVPPLDVKGQLWWQEREKQEEEKKKKANDTKVSAKPGAAAGSGGPAVRGRGTTTPIRGAARGTPATRGTTSRGTAGRAASKVPAKCNHLQPATGRGAATPATRGATKSVGVRGSVTKPGSATKVATSATKTGSAAKSGSATPIVPVPESTKEEVKTTTSQPTKPAPINKKTHHARLGLARALARKPEDIEEAKKYYNEVMSMAPEIHDAYIELADMLIKDDPLGAVDIFAKFPVSDTASFDDAYIHGEIVRLLIKCEKYDDPRLGPNMISWGKIMGLAVLDKYVKILDDKFKSDLLMKVYAGVNGRDVDDPEMQAFFRHKCWI
ncbi:uncharacterized protein LOC141909757 [Tubulanus polymorphus]|uniref:uncharacterized protein LOC141909757 n=1 Tax=Tubulanus polymorphus TaxID=672921 RepID=UPI003DA686A9